MRILAYIILAASGMAFIAGYHALDSGNLENGFLLAMLGGGMIATASQFLKPARKHRQTRHLRIRRIRLFFH